MHGRGTWNVKYPNQNTVSSEKNEVVIQNAAASDFTFSHKN
jgi:hypothetical protein